MTYFYFVLQRFEFKVQKSTTKIQLWKSSIYYTVTKLQDMQEKVLKLSGEIISIEGKKLWIQAPETLKLDLPVKQSHVSNSAPCSLQCKLKKVEAKAKTLEDTCTVSGKTLKSSL